MAGYNRVVLVGNLTRDPDYKQLASGQAVCRLGLATNRQFKNKQTGSMVQEVCFIDIDVWGVQAESCNQYLQKGSPVLIEGRLKFDTWEDQAGQTRSKHSIVADRVVFLASASDTSEGTTELAKNDTQKNVGAETILEKELYSQIDEIKKRNVAKSSSFGASADKSARKEEGTGEIAFKDEPPFEDELPF
jgi:single-strand DNA-binding protein